MTAADYDDMVYPRVCGGTVEHIVFVGVHAGLSPRVRGNPRRSEPRAPGTRSIPACAGEPPTIAG